MNKLPVAVGAALAIVTTVGVEQAVERPREDTHFVMDVQDCANLAGKIISTGGIQGPEVFLEPCGQFRDDITAVSIVGAPGGEQILGSQIPQPLELLNKELNSAVKADKEITDSNRSDRNIEWAFAGLAGLVIGGLGFAAANRLGGSRGKNGGSTKVA
ncbi:hypothetical protein H7Y63_03885 [Polaromonas sp.]|nr:hypothetical protein [Candidatus Saccharibacteria bacterium]